VTLEELLADRSKMMKLFLIGFISSLVFMGLGAVIILMQLLK
jgi:hypothetical protein